MEIQIDSQKVISYLANRIASLETDIGIKNAYIDQQAEHIKLLEGQLKLMQGEGEKKVKENTSGKIIDLPKKEGK